MEKVVNVLHMNGGTDDASYAKNSSLQKKIILMTKPIREQVVTGLCSNLSYPKSLKLADLGCSSGPNTLLTWSQIIKTIENIYNKMNHAIVPELQIFLNDLPCNDFNTLFKLLPKFQDDLNKDLGYTVAPAWLFNGVPGSFYSRLFPANNLHFVHSSYSLHWLSQVPEGLESNKRNICMSTTSPPNVLKAYYEQFENDFLTFIKFRSVELVIGGRMILTYLGRKYEDSSKNETSHIWELLGSALNKMVAKGRIQDEILHSFNLPIYTPSPMEIKKLIEEEGSFSIDHLQTFEVHWTGCDIDTYLSTGLEDDVDNVVKGMRAVFETLLVNHFGETIIDEVFYEYKQGLYDCMYNEKEKAKYVNVTVALTKKSEKLS